MGVSADQGSALHPIVKRDRQEDLPPKVYLKFVEKAVCGQTGALQGARGTWAGMALGGWQELQRVTCPGDHLQGPLRRLTLVPKAGTGLEIRSAPSFQLPEMMGSEPARVQAPRWTFGLTDTRTGQPGPRGDGCGGERSSPSCAS